VALVVYGVTAAVVLKWLAQLSASNAARPGTADITDEWIQLAAAEVEDALLEGGLSSTSVDSTTTPSAYYQLRHIVARLAALSYAQSIGLPTSEGIAAQWHDDLKAKLDDIRQGRRVGELSAADGPQAARFYGGDWTTSDLDAQRVCLDDEL
jgi:hypothetical protein